MDINQAKLIFGNNYIGIDELKPFFKAIGLGDVDFQDISITYSDADLLEAAREGYILIFGVGKIEGQYFTLRYLRDKFGVNPEIYEPCFYNQDWYLAESFIDEPLSLGWYLIKKDVLADTRAEQPGDILSKGVRFPSAILCAYTFFAYFFARNEYLWWHDFVWCSDVDHNGDRIYVGKYHDIDGVNKNGFSIHRHLALRPCYGSVNYIE